MVYQSKRDGIFHEERMMKWWKNIETRSITSPFAMELDRAAPLPKDRPEGGGAGDTDRFLPPGVASGSKTEGAGASPLLPLFTGRVLDPGAAS